MKPLHLCDLFCGAGGSVTGASEAVAMLGYQPRVTAVNHWNTATDTLKLNHPEANVLCTGIDDVNPRALFGEDELQILTASPECTHHSVARGGRPVNEQSRSTAMCVIKWAEALRPPVIIVENVPEFRTWGPLIRKRVVVPAPTYSLWASRQESKKRTVSRTAYRAFLKVYNRHARTRLEWVPDPERKGALFRAWCGMLEATGYRVDHRVIRCADYGDPTTRRRLFIMAVRGRRKIVWPNPTHSETPSRELFDNQRGWASSRDHVIDWSLRGSSIYSRKKPLSPKTMARIFAGLAKFGLKPFVVPQHSGKDRVESVEQPLAPVTTTSRGVGLCDPFIVELRGTAERHMKAHSVDAPMPAQTGNTHSYLAQPFIVPNFGERDGQPARVHGIDEPLPTVTGRGAGNLLTPVVIQTDQTSTRDGSCAHSVDEPLHTVVSKQNAGLALPFLVQVSRGNGKDPNGKANSRRVKGIHEPMPTVCGNRGEWALCEPSLLPQHAGGVLRGVDQPVPTVTTDGAIALIEPIITKYYGKSSAQSINTPLDTVTGNDRFGLAEPIVFKTAEGTFMLDILYRMFQPHELAAAQGFRRDYRFVGNKTDVVKQIGNAVPRRTMRALVLAAQSQDPDVSKYLDELEAAA